MTTKFLDSIIFKTKILLSCHFPRKTAFWGRFSSLPPTPPPLKKHKFHFNCRLAVSENGSFFSGVAKLQGHKHARCKLSKVWSRSYREINRLHSATNEWSRSYRSDNQKTFRYLWRFYSLLFCGFFVVFSWLFRGPLLSRKTVFGPFSLLFRGFFVAFLWLFRGPRFGQILRVLALEQSSEIKQHPNPPRELCDFSTLPRFHIVAPKPSNEQENS